MRCGWAVVLLVGLAAGPGRAEEVTAVAAPPSPAPAAAGGLDLRAVLAASGRVHPELAVARAELDAARATESLARATRRSPRLNGTAAFGLVPAARGTVFDSPDSPRDLDELGPFWRARLDFTMPLHTFGALAEAERAARAGVGARQARERARRAAGELLAARAYLGWQLSRKSLDLVADVRRHLDDHLAKIEEDPDSDPVDLYRARNARFQLDVLEARARRGLDEAEGGLRELVGEARPVSADLVPLEPGAPGLAAAEAEALARNPELGEAELAAEARAHLAESARRERWPALGLEGRFDVGRASNRDQQDNPFVYDAFNVRSATAALGLRWDVSFRQSGARLARERAEAEAARARSQALRARVRVDLAALHARLTEAAAVHETSRRALSTTASWLRLAEENHGLGTASTKDVIEASTAYLQARAAQLEAVHDLDLAVLGWRLALGRSPLEEGEDP